MSWNGSGTYSRTDGVYSGTDVWVQNRNAAVKIKADRHDTHDQDLAAGINACLTKNGENAATANLPMGTFKHTGVASASGSSSRTEYVSTATLQDGSTVHAGTTGGTSTAYTCSLSPAITAYANKQRFLIKFDQACGATPTINFNGVGAKKMYVNVAGTATQVTTGGLAANQVAELVYDTALDGGSGAFWFANELPGYATSFARTILASSGAVTSSGLTQATARLLGRTTAGTGAIEEISVGTGLTLSAGTLAGSVGNHAICQGRLTLTSGVPITTSDVTAAGTLYFTPYLGNLIGTYSGSAWSVSSFTEKSLSLTLTSGKPYDIFIVDGTLALEALVWTDDTTRATALTLQDGVYVKSGQTTRRYLGTIYASASNQTEDSFAKRYVWNMYNRTPRHMRVVEVTNSWTYTTATYRQANANGANQIDFVRGLNEDVVVGMVLANLNPGTATDAGPGIGLDSTTVNSAGVMGARSSTASGGVSQTAWYENYPGIGRHVLVWLEISSAAGTTNWYGDNNLSFLQSGIIGHVLG